MAKNQVLGLVFSEDLSEIVLIRKNRPTFLAGMLNGVGGQVEGGESHRSAMEREFKEETGVRIIPGWSLLDTAKFDNNSMFVWTCRADISQVATKTDEEIIICNVAKIYEEHPFPNVLNTFYYPGMPLEKRITLADHMVPDVLHRWLPYALEYHRERMNRIIK